jgi:hypothetical protein
VVTGSATSTVNGGNGGNRGGASSGGGAGGTTAGAGNGSSNGGGGGSRGRTLFAAATPCPTNTVTSCGTSCANVVNCTDTNPCTAEACVSGACSYPAGNAGAVCRTQANICDAIDTCTGSSTTCPNAYAAQGTDCGYSTGGVVIYQTGAPANALDFQNSFSSFTITNAGPTADWPDALRYTSTSASGAAARFQYVRFSTTARTFLATDLIEYDVYLADSQASLGGIDVATSAGYLRDAPAAGVGPATDQNGLTSHPDADLIARAAGKWYHRRFALNGLAIVGRASTKWDVVNENDNPSATYTAYYDNVMVAVKPGACDGANVCKIKAGAACGAASECASGTCTGSVCQ